MHLLPTTILIQLLSSKIILLYIQIFIKYVRTFLFDSSEFDIL